MEKEKQCSKCKEPVLMAAQKCKHCGADLRNWFIRHKVITVIGALFLIGLIGNQIKQSNNTQSQASLEERIRANNQAAEDALREADGTKGNLNYDYGFSSSTKTTTTTSDESSAKYTKEKCNSVKIGMSESSVKDILGEPTSTSESQMAGVGMTKMWQFQEAFSFKGCQVFTTNGKVSSVSWVEL